MRKKLLFLCTGNSCRSIMAEVLLNHKGKAAYIAYSAGSFPTGQVNPDSLTILHENQLPVGNLISQSWNDLSHIDFDIVITVCDNAANEVCPVYLGRAIKVHWGINDPDKIVGKKRKQSFDYAFRQLEERIDKLLNLSGCEIDAESLNKIGEESL